MPKLPPSRKSAKSPQLPASTQEHACVAAMRHDLDKLKTAATSRAFQLCHEQVLPEHFLYAVLYFPDYFAVLNCFFNEFAISLVTLSRLVDKQLERLPVPLPPPNRQMPDFNPQCKKLFQEIDFWLDETRKGNCLPFICLVSMLQLGHDEYVTKLLNRIGFDTADLLSEIAYLEFRGFVEIPADFQDTRTPADRHFERLHRDLMRISERATRFAIEHSQRYLLPEHLLLGLVATPKFKPFFQHLPDAIDFDGLVSLCEQIEQFLLKNVERQKDGGPPEVTPAFQRTTEKIIRLAQPEKNLITFPPLALYAIIQCNPDLGKQLKQLGFKLKELLKQAQEPLPDAMPTNNDALEKPDDDTFDDIKFDDSLDFPMGDIPFGESSAGLADFAVELVELALQGKIDPLVGRQEELDRLVEILHKKRSSNAMIIGNEGVGKTAVVEGLALRIARKEVPDTLQESKIYSLNLGAMIAGTEFRGAFEQRLTNCLKEIAAQPKSFLFIDEIHTILGAGNGGRDGTLDAGNILKPYLARGEVRCIGATTYDEYQKRILSDRAFARRFMRISLAEPSRDETLQILQGLVGTYEEFHHVRFSPDILEYIVELSGRYVHEKYFPDKAIEVMDECGAHYRSGLAQGTEVTREDVERVVCRVANLPAITVQTDDREKLRGLAERLQAKIFGQDEAIGELVRRVKVAKAGFQDARRPLLTAFLCGPSGCGKTELARQLATELGIAFVKLDMSEYSEEYAASRLIGSAPGYVGYDRPGALTEPVIQTPHCLLLLDEIEKAHAAVFNLLLQVLDDGRLTDNKGREASFRNAIILMTSNAGSRAAAEAINLLGFSKSDAEQSHNRQEIIQRVMKKTFPPEFRNRIQLTVMMNDLNRPALESIVRKSLATVNQQLAEQKVTITLTAAAVAQIAQRAEDEHLGGRPVERLVDQVVKQHIVDELLFGKLAHGGTVAIDYCDGEFQYLYGK